MNNQEYFLIDADSYFLPRRHDFRSKTAYAMWAQMSAISGHNAELLHCFSVVHGIN